MIDIFPSYCPLLNNNLFFSFLASIIGHSIVPFFSGRSAMVYGLSAFGLSRKDEILVPQYLSHCVLSAISRTSFPTMTPSKNTKAILVYHQFGFPQQLSRIEAIARENNWIILNDCANTLFTKVSKKYLINWGDFTVVSLAKIYHCGLGGGFWTNKWKISPSLLEQNELDKEIAEEAFDFYIKIHQGCFGQKKQMKIHALYGYLPDIKSMAVPAMNALPGSLEEIYNDMERRKRIYTTALDIFGDKVPVCDDEVVPFAIPVSGKREKLLLITEKIQSKFEVCAPVLHFDYVRNMFEPDYRPAIVVGCHDDWNEEIVNQIFRLIKKEL